MNNRLRAAGLLAGICLAGLAVAGCQQLPAAAPVADIANPAAPAVHATGSGEKEQTVAGASPTREAMFEGTVVSINPDRRLVTFRLDDGKTVRLKVGQGAGALTPIRKGDRAAFSLRETVEVIQDASFHPRTGHLVDRPSPGSTAEREEYNAYFHRSPTGHHAVNWSEVIDIPARVAGVDTQSRLLKLKTYDGRLIEVRPETSNNRMDFATFKLGEPVVARFRELDDIRVVEATPDSANHTLPSQP